MKKRLNATQRRKILSRVEGTAFQKRVWDALLQIPQGEVRSYGEIARMIGRPKAARAVGMACHDNQLPVIIPCHRVVGSNGKLTGFALGLKKKAELLRAEGIAVAGNSVVSQYA